MVYIIGSESITASTFIIKYKEVYNLQNTTGTPVECFVASNQILKQPLNFLKNQIGAKAETFCDIIYDQIWIYPNNINTGLITEDKIERFYIWNAFRNQSVTISDIQKYQLYTETIIDNLVNFILNPLQEKQTAILYPLTGNTTFNGAFIFSFSNINYTLSLQTQGLRVLPIPIIKFVENTLEIIYTFNIIITSNLNLLEQRRLLIDKSKKIIKGQFFVNNIFIYKIYELLDKIGGICCGIPFVIEPLTPTNNILQNLSQIQVKETFNDYIELFNTNYVLLYDDKNNIFEIKEIIDRNTLTKTITLRYPITQNFTGKFTIIYPVIFVDITDIKIISLSHEKALIELEAKEITI